MSDDTEAREIAGRLTEAQRVLTMHGVGFITASKAEAASFPAGMWKSVGAMGQGRYGYDLTPFGFRVRAILAAQQGGGA